MQQAGQQLGISAMPLDAGEQSEHRLLGAPQIQLEIRVVVVSQRQVGIQVQRPSEGVLRLRVVVRRLRTVAPVPEAPIHAAQSGPRGRVGGILLQTLQIQIARLSGGLIVPAELRRAQIRLIGTRTGRDVLLQRALFVAGQGHRQRRDDLTRQIVLQREQIAERGLRPVRPLDGAGWRVHELGANPELVTDTARAISPECDVKEAARTAAAISAAVW